MSRGKSKAQAALDKVTGAVKKAGEKANSIVDAAKVPTRAEQEKQPEKSEENWVKSTEERQEMSAKMKRADNTEPMCMLMTNVDYSHGECGHFYPGIAKQVPTRCALQLEHDFPEVIESMKELKVIAPPETK